MNKNILDELNQYVVKQLAYVKTYLHLWRMTVIKIG